MAYDEGLAEVMRDDLGARDGISEKKMFGGIAFLLNGNMVCGVHGGGERRTPAAEVDVPAFPRYRGATTQKERRDGRNRATADLPDHPARPRTGTLSRPSGSGSRRA
ncbi:hypothetical protein DQW77_05640 [Roseovarius sp. TE539]|nr:hypothetical protein DQW77_05640 [Roseovarius sp. TE539]